MRVKRAALFAPSGGVEVDLGSRVHGAEAIGNRRASCVSSPISASGQGAALEAVQLSRGTRPVADGRDIVGNESNAAVADGRPGHATPF